MLTRTFQRVVEQVSHALELAFLFSTSSIVEDLSETWASLNIFLIEANQVAISHERVKIKQINSIESYFHTIRKLC